MTATIRRAVGNLLVVGLGGTELTGLERAWLRLVRPGGVILFKRNIADAAVTRALLDEATGLGASFGARCVDVEGGTVNRLRDALGNLPSAQAVGRTSRMKQKPAPAREFGELIALAVRAFGFNTTLAPVLDLALAEAAEVLGTRTAGENAAEVVAFAREFLDGLAAHGIAGCGKDFPGLGGASGDSHLVTPDIGRTWSQMWNEDMAPYRELNAAMPMVMVNHAAYPRTRGGSKPASASAFWITTVLRKRIGYRGIILSDDLEMGGILKFMPIEEAAIEAVRAGSDLIEICHSPELILRSYEALIAEAERSAAFRNLLLGRARDVQRKRSGLFAGGVSRALTLKQTEALRRRIERFGDLIAADDASSRTTTPVERT